MSRSPHSRAGSELQIGIRWRSGAAEQHPITRPPTYNDTTRTPRETIELIAGLVAEHTNSQIAAELNAAGLRTGRGLPFNAHAVRHIRRAHQIPTLTSRDDHDLTVNQVAEHLISRDAIYYWVRHGRLNARRNDTNRLRIPFDPEVEQECRKRIANSSRIRTQTQIPATRGAV
jgi:hypothetical protein